MGFKVLSKNITGSIEIFKFHHFYRLTSNREAGVTGLDLDYGLDEFLPITIDDADFGTAIRRCHNATRFMDWRNLPIKDAAKEANREWQKKFVLWEKKAMEITGAKK